MRSRVQNDIALASTLKTDEVIEEFKIEMPRKRLPPRMPIQQSPSRREKLLEQGTPITKSNSQHRQSLGASPDSRVPFLASRSSSASKLSVVKDLTITTIQRVRRPVLVKGPRTVQQKFAEAALEEECSFKGLLDTLNEFNL